MAVSRLICLVLVAATGCVPHAPPPPRQPTEQPKRDCPEPAESVQTDKAHKLFKENCSCDYAGKMYCVVGNLASGHDDLYRALGPSDRLYGRATKLTEGLLFPAIDVHLQVWSDGIEQGASSGWGAMSVQVFRAESSEIITAELDGLKAEIKQLSDGQYKDAVINWFKTIDALATQATEPDGSLLEYRAACSKLKKEYEAAKTEVEFRTPTTGPQDVTAPEPSIENDDSTTDAVE